MKILMLLMSFAFAKECVVDLHRPDQSVKQIKPTDVKSVYMEYNKTTVNTDSESFVVNESGEEVFKKVNACKSPAARNRGNVSTTR